MTASRRRAALVVSEGLERAQGSEIASTGRSDGVLRLTLPYPPTTNNLYMTVRGRRVKTEAARDYAEAVSNRVTAARALGMVPPLPPYGLYLAVFVPDRRRRDLSNTIKCLEDSLFAGIGQDDREVVCLNAVKAGVDKDNPRVEVTLWHSDSGSDR